MKMNKWVPESSQKILRRIGKTAEECAELSKVCARITIQGLAGINPESRLTNREELQKEVADVYAQLDETVESLGLNRCEIQARRNHKRELMKEWEGLFK